MAFTLFASYMINFFNRKTLLIGGHIAIAIIHASIGFFSIYHNNAGVVSMVMAFMVAYSMSSGPIAWLHASETVIDTGLGICIMVLFGTIFFLSLVCPILMDPSSLGTTRMFFLFSAISVLATLLWI